MQTNSRSHTKVEGNFNKAATRRAIRIKGVGTALALLSVPPLVFSMFQDRILRAALGPPDTEILLKNSQSSLPPDYSKEGGRPGNRTEFVADMSIRVTASVDPNYKPPATKKEKITLKLRGHTYEVSQHMQGGPVYLTSDGATQFYIGNIAAARSPAGLDGGFNVCTGLNQTTKVELRDGAFIMPCPVIELATLINTGFFEKQGLEFLGVIGTGYVWEGRERGQERRVGFSYVRGFGTAFNSLEQHPQIRCGYTVDQSGTMHVLVLPKDNYQPMLDKLSNDPNIRAISIFHHSKDTENQASFYNKGFRAPYVVFNGTGGFMGICYTSEAQNEADRDSQIKKQYPRYAYRFKLDGDFYWQHYFVRAKNPLDRREVPLSYENAQIVVRPLRPGHLPDYSQVMLDYKYGRSIVTNERTADVLTDIRNVEKIKQKISDKAPGWLQWAFARDHFGNEWAANWGVDNAYFRGWAVRQALKNDPALIREK